jgi:hypothetical protein
MKYIDSSFNTLQQYWRNANAAQKILFASGTVLFISMFTHSVALVLTGGSLHGPTSFRKAIAFAEALGLLCWSVGWMLPYLSLRPRVERFIAMFVAVFAIGEAFLMTLQVWRGVPSHYNFITLFDTLVFSATGIGAIGFAVVTAFLLRVSLQPSSTPPSIMLSIRAGLLITLIGATSGMVMSVNAGPTWQGVQALGQRFGPTPLGRYVGQPEGLVGGNLIVLHALGVHGLQLLPLVGWLLTYSSLPERARYRLVGLTAVSVLAFLGVLAVQAFRGLPLTAFDPVTATALVLAGATALACYVAAGWYATQGVIKQRMALAISPT